MLRDESKFQSQIIIEFYKVDQDYSTQTTIRPDSFEEFKVDSNQEDNTNLNFNLFVGEDVINSELSFRKALTESFKDNYCAFLYINLNDNFSCTYAPYVLKFAKEKNIITVGIIYGVTSDNKSKNKRNVFQNLIKDLDSYFVMPESEQLNDEAVRKQGILFPLREMLRDETEYHYRKSSFEVFKNGGQLFLGHGYATAETNYIADSEAYKLASYNPITKMSLKKAKKIYHVYYFNVFNDGTNDKSFDIREAGLLDEKEGELFGITYTAGDPGGKPMCEVYIVASGLPEECKD